MAAGNQSRRTSILLAAAIAIGMVAWLLSGLGNSISDDGRESSSGRGDATAMSVSVRTSRAQRLTREITVSARTEPDRAIELKAETRGTVTEAAVERGAFVPRGDTIVSLDMRDRRASLAEARALIEQREIEFEAAQRLKDQQFISAAELASAEAQLVAARAAEERILLDIERTDIRAPFDAIVHDRVVEIGDYIDIGDPIAELVDIDPLIVVGFINEADVLTLEVGGSGYAHLIDAEDTVGTIRYVAPVADESTRSFRVELAVPNPDLELSVGTTAELVLRAEEITAHEIPSSVLTLDENGTVGVMTVDDADRVGFFPIEQAGSSDGSLLVTGLPDVTRIITVGQGFVIPGQSVTAVEQDVPPRERNERPH